jgi:ribosomal protein L16 Arg81 hydroxylase
VGEQNRFEGRYGARETLTGAELLARFSFIPHARLDDLMVSYAVPGGGVGPHFDSYDVFLLQGFGRRRRLATGGHLSD